MTYQSTTSMEQLAERVMSAETIVCTSHEKPDGDAMGSVLGVVRSLGDSHAMHAWMLGSIPPPIEALARGTALTRIREAADVPDLEPDLILVLDTGAWGQLRPIEQWLRDRSDRVIGIDHHASGDPVAPARVVDASAASCTMLALQLLDCVGRPLIPEVAEPLFAGLATDTGWFRQANADAAAFAVAARLLATGVDKDGLHREIEETARRPRLALQARALASIEWIHGGQVALMQLTRDDFEETDGRRSDVTGMVNAPLIVEGSEMGVLLIEEKEGGVKASFRSKPPATPGGAFLDARNAATHLGGGGHVHAAGARIEGTMLEAKRAVEAALKAL
ncbi:MAG: DHH family phosphoesterase [Phycisphaerales bacterium]|jgi:phosphoesterase RecJ-like protein|nr:DHH family phosphoesterase [Phycisphaerales bacterium]